MNQISLIQGAVPQHIAQSTGAGINDNAAAGWDAGGFGVVSIRGKVWRIRARREEQVLTAPPGPGLAPVPVQLLPVIIVGIAQAKSKRFYLNDFTEDRLMPPDCYSVNGVAPDPASPAKQSESCAACEWNRFGTAKGTGRGKRCSDHKRIAVLLADDALRAQYPDPLLLDLPPTSVPNLISCAADLKRFGFDMTQVRTALAFDYAQTHQVVTFAPIGFVENAELYAEALEHSRSDLVKRIINNMDELDELKDNAPMPAALAGPVPPHLASPPAPPAPAPAPTPVQAAAVPSPAPASAPAPAPAPTPVQAAPAPAPVGIVQGAPADLESEIDDLLSASV